MTVAVLVLCVLMALILCTVVLALIAVAQQVQDIEDELRAWGIRRRPRDRR